MSWKSHLSPLNDERVDWEKRYFGAINYIYYENICYLSVNALISTIFLEGSS